MFREAYVAKRRAEAAREGEDKPFVVDVADSARDHLHRQAVTSSVTSPL